MPRVSVRTSHCALLSVLAIAAVAAGAEPVRSGAQFGRQLASRLLDGAVFDEELRLAVLRRVPPLVRPDEPEAWAADAKALRERVLRDVVYKGVPAEWIEAKPAVKWLDRIETGHGYTIRKLQYEGYPGLWIPAVLYEPARLKGKVPAVYNTNGHVGAPGNTVAYKQIRCINLAKRGILALNPEWIGMGQLAGSSYAHTRLAYLDLCGRSGLSVFYLAMKRALDVLCAHPHADPDRIGVTGLSGGGWQTILISALDERVRLCVPNAGYIGLPERLLHRGDVGDLEQNPVDLVRIADYTHLTALLAPRPALLIYNEKDNCCFAAARARASVYEPIAPIYAMFGAGADFVFHMNTDPGTHNYALDNRQQFYRFVNRNWLPADARIDDEIPSDNEVLAPEALRSPVPANNATFQSLALEAALDLPVRHVPAISERIAWQRESRAVLENILRFERWEARARQIRQRRDGPYEFRDYTVRVGERWTIPATVVKRMDAEPTGVAIVVTDRGRAGEIDLKRTLADDGYQVVCLDVLFVGECVPGHGTPGSVGQMLGTVGLRPLGIQTAQILAAARLARQEFAVDSITLVGSGRVSSLAALVAAALDPDTIRRLVTVDLPTSLKQLIEQGVDYNRVPSLFCFGLLEQFDVRELLAMVAPRPVERREAKPVEGNVTAPSR